MLREEFSFPLSDEELDSFLLDLDISPSSSKKEATITKASITLEELLDNVTDLTTTLPEEEKEPFLDLPSIPSLFVTILYDTEGFLSFSRPQPKRRFLLIYSLLLGFFIGSTLIFFWSYPFKSAEKEQALLIKEISELKQSIEKLQTQLLPPVDLPENEVIEILEPPDPLMPLVSTDIVIE